MSMSYQKPCVRQRPCWIFIHNRTAHSAGDALASAGLRAGEPSRGPRRLRTSSELGTMRHALRRVTQIVKQWCDADMGRRSTAPGSVAAENRFRRMKRGRDLRILVRVLRGHATTLDPRRMPRSRYHRPPLRPRINKQGDIVMDLASCYTCGPFVFGR